MDPQERFFDQPKRWLLLDIEPLLEEAPSPCQGLARIIARFQALLEGAEAELEGMPQGPPRQERAQQLEALRRRIEELRGRQDPGALGCALPSSPPAPEPLEAQEARRRLEALFSR